MKVLFIALFLLMIAFHVNAQETIDLLESKILANDRSSDDQFGWDVAISGDTVVVGARGANPGAVYVLQQNEGTWVQQSKLTSGFSGAGPFGASVDISGDTIVVGDYSEYPGVGAAYIFQRTGSNWALQARIVPSDSAVGDHFGTSVAINGDTIVVGANDAIHSGGQRGAAYVFQRSGTTWTQQAKLITSDLTIVANFGYSVDIDEDTIAVGAPDGAAEGSVHIFRRAGVNWPLERLLLNPDPVSVRGFGVSVSLSDETLAVGAPYLPEPVSASGSVYIFQRNQGAWVQQAKLEIDSPTRNGFGYDVGLDENTLLVGAYADDHAGTASGAAFLYKLNGGSWVQQTKITASDASEDDEFGYSVALRSDRFVMGAPTIFISPFGARVGSVYIYEPVLNSPPSISLESLSVFVDEGQVASNTILVNDPDGDLITVSASNGNVFDNGDGTWYWSFNTTDGAIESQTVTVFAEDDRDGTDEAAFDLVVLNISPVATFTNPHTISEGDFLTLSFSNPFDPSPADTLAGFYHSFDCTDDGILEASESPSSTFDCLYTDNDDFVAKGRISDKDGGYTDYTTQVTVSNVPPIVDAGSDLSTTQGSLVAFSGSFTDPGIDDTHTILWDFGDGITASDTLAPTHTYATNGVYTVTLTITDDDDGSNSDTLTVTVASINHPPLCSTARPSINTIWPPNPIRFVPVDVLDVTDPNGDSITITITGIRQDEPVGPLFKPDGRGVNTSTAQIRSEAHPLGNGRVYHISFRASDEYNNSCTGVIKVGVQLLPRRPAVDGGPLYDSTLA